MRTSTVIAELPKELTEEILSYFQSVDPSKKVWLCNNVYILDNLDNSPDEIKKRIANLQPAEVSIGEIISDDDGVKVMAHSPLFDYIRHYLGEMYLVKKFPPTPSVHVSPDKFLLSQIEPDKFYGRKFVCDRLKLSDDHAWYEEYVDLTNTRFAYQRHIKK